MMNRRTLKKILISAWAIGLLSLFQNCSMVSDHQSVSPTQQGLGEKAITVLKNNCASCHGGAQPMNPPNNILDVPALIEQGYIVPGQPESSVIYTSLFANMPLGRPALSASDKELIRTWILALAEDGTPPAQLIISDEPSFDFGSVASGSSGEHSFTVENVGKKFAIGLAGSGLQSPFLFSGGAFPGVGGSCGAELAPNATCTIKVTFAPSSAGDFNDEIEIIYADGPSPLGQVRTVKREVRGQGTGSAVASLQLSDGPTYGFGLVNVSSVSAKTFTLSNTGSTTATAVSGAPISAPFRYKGGAYPGTGGTCTSTLAAGQACSVILEFAPLSSGPYTGSFIVNYNGPASRSVSVNLTGTGAGGGSPVYYSTVRAILSSSCNSCHDSEWGSSYSSLLAFKSGSEATPAIVPGSLASRFIARISGEMEGKPQMGVAPRGSLSAENRQKIVDWIAGGALNDPAGLPAVLNISDGPTYNFGTVTIGMSAEHSFTVTNNGESLASAISGVSLAQPFSFKGGAFPGTGGSCGATLAQGASCTVVLRFNPSTPGVTNSILQLNYFNGQANASTTRTLTGTGAGVSLAVLQLSPAPSHDFGARALGSSTGQIFTLSNVGSAPAASLSLVALASPYGATSTCGTTLAVGASCALTVTFSPNVAGEFSSALTINYNNGQSAQSVSSSLHGIGAGGAPIYYSEIREILNQSSCNACHSGHWGTSYSGLLNFKYPGQTTLAITPGDLNSRFVQYITNPPPGKPKMGDGTYGTLTPANVQKILNWIGNGAPDDPAGTITQEFRPLSGDRHYLGSVLHKVFGDTGARVRSFSRGIYERGDLFGAPCHFEDAVYLSEESGARRNQIYVGDDSCRDKVSEESALHAETVPDSSPVSESTRQSACMRLAERTDNISFALAAVGLEGSSPFNAVNVGRVFERFKPGSAPRTEAVNALMTIGSQALSDPLLQPTPGQSRNFEGWRFILMSVCLSPTWLSL